jgi:hypothetical protein
MSNLPNSLGGLSDQKYIFKYIKTSKIGALFRSFFFVGQVVLNKDHTVWLDVATPTNTCIIPILPRVHAWMATQHIHPQKYVCKYI